jgi:hypothetical protein
MLAQIYDAVLVGDVGVGEARREQRGHLIDGLQNIFHCRQYPILPELVGENLGLTVGFDQFVLLGVFEAGRDAQGHFRFADL